MSNNQHNSLNKVMFIRGSVKGLLTIARAERFEMIEYLLEMVWQEAQELERRLAEELAKRD
jgi:hypothetical protein